MELETSVTVDIRYQGWITLNVTRSVSDWMRAPARNHGLALRVTTTDVIGKDVATSGMSPLDCQLTDVNEISILINLLNPLSLHVVSFKLLLAAAVRTGHVR
jgi:hypothetical protein